jgi:signal peptidase I
MRFRLPNHALIGFFCWLLAAQSLADANSENTSCATVIKTLPVSGRSMTGLVEDGEMLTAEFGQYDCQPVMRGDWVLYRFGNARSYVKVVRGLFPDRFAVEPIVNDQGDDEPGWLIFLNGKRLTTSTGEPFRLEPHKGAQLRDEEQMYNGKIPLGKFLIMGNRPEGTHDSSWYGLVNRNQLLARLKK